MVRLVPLLTVLVLGVAATAARATAPADAVLSYELMLGGFTIGTAEVHIDVPEGADGPYSLAADLRTEGLLNTFTGFEARGETSGRVAAGLPLPELHESRSTWRNEPRRVGLTFNGADTPPAAEVVPPPDADEREPVAPSDTAGSVDPLSGVLHLVSGAARGGAVAPVTVFDGRRLYSLALGDGAPASVETRAWSGEAWRADLHYERLGGASRRHDSRKTIDGTVYLASGAAFDLPVAVPLRIVVPTPGLGALVVELTAARPGDA